MAYIQINPQASPQEQIKQMKNQVELLLDQIEGVGFSFDDLTDEQKAELKGEDGEDGEDAESATAIPTTTIDAIIA